jgi:hypothetical protein
MKNYIFHQENIFNIGMVTLEARCHLKVKDSLTIVLHLVIFSAVILDSLKVKQ